MRSRRSTPEPEDSARPAARPGRRATALATLAFTAALAPPAAASSQRGQQRATVPKQPSQVRAVAPRLTGRIDADRLGAQLGIHPGRAAAALRAVDAQDATVDPVSALARELRLPVARVGLALATASRQ